MNTLRWKRALWGLVALGTFQPGIGVADIERRGGGQTELEAKVSYQFWPLTVLEAAYAIPLKINDKADVVGYAEFKTGVHGFLYNLESGRFEEVAVPGACATFPTAVNNRLQIVGTYYTGSCEEPGAQAHAFLMEADGTVATIDILTGSFTAPEGINDQGEVCGSVMVNGVQQGFLMQCANTDLGGFTCASPIVFAAPGVGTFLTRANDIVSDITGREITAGEFLDHPESNRQHGFRREENGEFVTIDYPGALGTSVAGLDTDTMVGFWYTLEPGTHSWLFKDKQFLTIDPVSLGAVSSSATDINRHGIIVGIYSDADKDAHGYVATPQ